MILKAGINRYVSEKMDALEIKMRNYCEEILDRAIDFRLSNPRAHNFTGNLINSIVVGLYREGHLVFAATPGANLGIDPPIRRKMTYPKKYYFGEKQKLGMDWDTVPSSFYEPEMVTRQTLGGTDAKNFINSYKADKKAMFQIVVAYTTEYAAFVDRQRSTTGYMSTVAFIQMSAPKVIQG